MYPTSDSNDVTVLNKVSAFLQKLSSHVPVVGGYPHKPNHYTMFNSEDLGEFHKNVLGPLSQMRNKKNKQALVDAIKVYIMHEFFKANDDALAYEFEMIKRKCKEDMDCEQRELSSKFYFDGISDQNHEYRKFMDEKLQGQESKFAQDKFKVTDAQDQDSVNQLVNSFMIAKGKSEYLRQLLSQLDSISSVYGRHRGKVNAAGLAGATALGALGGAYGGKAWKRMKKYWFADSDSDGIIDPSDLDFDSPLSQPRKRKPSSKSKRKPSSKSKRKPSSKSKRKPSSKSTRKPSSKRR